MKKIVMMMFAFVAIASCGNKTNSAVSDADSIVINEVPDMLDTVEAIMHEIEKETPADNTNLSDYAE